jgi:tetratricopeptide (TPR) repeat protein
MIPAGVLWRLAPKGTVRPDPSHFRFEREAEEVPGLYRRIRGIEKPTTGAGTEIHFEPYERRLAKAVLRARRNLAEWYLRNGNAGAALPLLESVVAFEDGRLADAWILQQLGLCHSMSGDRARAAQLLAASLGRAEHDVARFVSLLALGDLARLGGDEAGARRCYQEASALPGLSAAQRAEAASRLSAR